MLNRSMRRPKSDPPPTTAQSEPTTGAFAREFDLLQDMTQTILEAAQALTAALDGRAPFAQTWHTIRDLEHKGDAIARDLFEILLTPRPGPVDVHGGRAARRGVTHARLRLRTSDVLVDADSGRYRRPGHHLPCRQ